MPRSLSIPAQSSGSLHSSGMLQSANSHRRDAVHSHCPSPCRGCPCRAGWAPHPQSPPRAGLGTRELCTAGAAARLSAARQACQLSSQAKRDEQHTWTATLSIAHLTILYAIAPSDLKAHLPMLDRCTQTTDAGTKQQAAGNVTLTAMTTSAPAWHSSPQGHVCAGGALQRPAMPCLARRAEPQTAPRQPRPLPCCWPSSTGRASRPLPACSAAPQWEWLPMTLAAVTPADGTKVLICMQDQIQQRSHSKASFGDIRSDKPGLRTDTLILE